MVMTKFTQALLCLGMYLAFVPSPSLAQIVSGFGTMTNPASPAPAVNGLQSWASTTWTPRSVQAGTGIIVTNGDGVAGNPLVALDASQVVNGSQWQSGSFVFAAGTGTATAQVATLTPPLLVYTTGMVVYLRPSATNTGGLTLNLGPGVAGVLTPAGGALTAGMMTAGQLYPLWYDGAAFRQLGTSLADIATLSGTNTFTGSSDFGGASAARPNKRGLFAARPATCSVGDTYWSTDAIAGQNVTGCTSTNTWTLLGGVSGALIAANNLSDLASASTARTNLGLAAIASSGSASDLGTGTIPAARIPASLPAVNTGTATALAAAPTRCAAGQATTGIAVSGNSMECFTPASGVTGFVVTRTTSTLMDFTAGSVHVNNVFTSIPLGSITVTAGAGGPHTTKVYATSAGVMTVKSVPGVTFTCSGCTIATPEAVPVVPLNAIPIATLTVTAGAWDTTIVREVPTVSTTAITPGAGVREGTPVGGARVLEADPATVMMQGGTNVGTGAFNLGGATATATIQHGTNAARPTTCTYAGQLYSQSDGTAGLYRHTGAAGASCVWVAVDTTAAFTDLAVTRTSGTVEAVALGKVKFPGVTHDLPAATATITAGSGSGAAEWYVTAAGAIVVEHATAAGLTISCSGCTASQVTTPAVPAGAYALASTTVASGAWSTTITDRRAQLTAPDALISGTGIIVDPPSGGARTVRIDTADVPRLGGTNVWTGSMDGGAATLWRPRTGSGAPSGGCTGTANVGNEYTRTDVIATGAKYVCTQTSGGTYAWVQQVIDVPGALIAANNLSDLASASTARTNLGLAAVAASGSASDITTGTLPLAQVPTSVARTANNLSDLASASTARTNLGLAAVASSGSASDLGTGTLPDARLSAGVVRIVSDEASALTARNSLNFTGAGVTCADNAGATRTDCTIPGGGMSGQTAGRFLYAIDATTIGSLGIAVAGAGTAAEAYTFTVAAALTTTTTPGVTLENSTAATAGTTVQNGHSLASFGRLWASGGGTSVPFGAHFGSYGQSSSTGVAWAAIRTTLNGTQSTSQFLFNAATGVFTHAAAPQTAGLAFTSNSFHWRNSSAVATASLADAGAIIHSTGRIGAASGALGSAPTCDTCLSRNAAGVFEVDNGTAGLGNRRDVLMRALILATSDAKPTCDSSQRGKFYLTQGGAGVADTAEVCTKDASDVYAWRSLY